MSVATDNLLTAQSRATQVRPPVGGFPYLAQVLREAGVTRNEWSLPSCESLYWTDSGIVVQQGEPLTMGLHDVPVFNKDALVVALRADQAGQTTFAEFLASAWSAGVVRYVIDLEERAVTYYGVQGEAYAEDYPAVSLDMD